MDSIFFSKPYVPKITSLVISLQFYFSFQNYIAKSFIIPKKGEGETGEEQTITRDGDFTL